MDVRSGCASEHSFADTNATCYLWQLCEYFQIGSANRQQALSVSSLKWLAKALLHLGQLLTLRAVVRQAGEYVGVGGGEKEAEGLGSKDKGPAAGRTDAKRTIEGYKAQSEMVIGALDHRLAWSGGGFPEKCERGHGAQG